MSTRRRIAILGGGYTGMVAAHDLCEAHEVTLYERSTSLGGLADDFTLHGASLERAYHHLFRSDRDIIELARELGVADELQWLPALMAIFHDGSFHRFSGALDLLRFAPLSLSARLRLGFAMWRLSRTTDWRPLVGQSAHTWLRKHAGEEAVSVLWGPLLEAKFQDACRDISMAWLWARIHIRARSRSSLTGPEQLGYFKGGFATFTRALEASITSRGAHLRLSSAVKALRRDENGRISVETATDQKAYDQVLVTAPSPVFSRLLPAADESMAAYRQSLMRTQYLAAMTCVFSTTQSLTNAYWTSIVERDNPFLVLVHHTALIGTNAFGGRHVYYLGQYLPESHPEFSDEDEVVMTRWLDCLARMMPKFRRESVLEKRLFRFRYAQHVVTTEYASLIPPARTPWPGLYLANFSQTFPEDRGTNFAVRDGRAVAALMNRDSLSHKTS